ncbi:NF038129 family PEP-CTERM protein [Massilia sp. TWR1-2-2]|uniref:NF038129 family PEP-CTERM protein n=1 Tax=Massilia sp. TWR1-2-2 TaxID=2804584 RepID=UPI003CFB705D
MFNPKTFLSQCLLAVALLGSSLAAIAGPTFNVSLNTTGLSGTGSVDFLLNPAVTALPLTAKVSNFSSNFGAFLVTGDAAVDANGNFTLSNLSADNFVVRAAGLGNTLSFDLNFDGAFFDRIGTEGGLFSFGLNGANGDLIGFATFDFNASLLPIVVDVTGFANATITLVGVNAVPEPSSMLMMMTGLGLVGFTARRRKSRAEEAATA